MADEGGVWRTIGGRRVFIKDGQSLTDAMRESGKFEISKKSTAASQSRPSIPKQVPNTGSNAEFGEGDRNKLR